MTVPYETPGFHSFQHLQRESFLSGSHFSAVFASFSGLSPPLGSLVAYPVGDATDADDAQESLTTAETELAKPQPNGGRVLRKLDALSQIVTRSAETAQAAGKLGAMVIQLAPLAATVWQIAQKLLGG